MAILSTVVKDFFRQKTNSGYITLKPKTDADCVAYINSNAVETDVQTELDEINNNLYDIETNITNITNKKNYAGVANYELGYGVWNGVNITIPAGKYFVIRNCSAQPYSNDGQFQVRVGHNSTSYIIGQNSATYGEVVEYTSNTTIGCVGLHLKSGNTIGLRFCIVAIRLD